MPSCGLFTLFPDNRSKLAEARLAKALSRLCESIELYFKLVLRRGEILNLLSALAEMNIRLRAWRRILSCLRL